MATESFTETKRVRYLLGLSSSMEREQIEAEYFDDDDAFQQMLAAEDDLFDAYTRGELTDGERRRFEQRFASSLDARDRVRFARALASEVSVAKTNFSGLAFFQRLQLPALLRTATIIVVIAFVVVPVWLFIDRNRMTNEPGQLPSQHDELSKEIEALRPSNEARTTGMSGQLEKPKRRTSKTPASRQSLPSPKIKIEPEQIVSKPKPDEEPVSALDTSDIDPVEVVVITHEPSLNDPTLPPTSSSSGTGFRSDLRGLALSGVEVDKPLYTYFLVPRQSGRGPSTIRIPTSQSLIRFRVRLEKTTGYKSYRFTIETEDGQPVSVGVSDLLMPGETTINTHALSTPPSGTYVLLLSGEESDGSFTKVAEYSFRVISF